MSAHFLTCTRQVNDSIESTRCNSFNFHVVSVFTYSLVTVWCSCKLIFLPVWLFCLFLPIHLFCSVIVCVCVSLVGTHSESTCANETFACCTTAHCGCLLGSFRFLLPLVIADTNYQATCYPSPSSFAYCNWSFSLFIICRSIKCTVCTVPNLSAWLLSPSITLPHHWNDSV